MSCRPLPQAVGNPYRTCRDSLQSFVAENRMELEEAKKRSGHDGRTWSASTLFVRLMVALREFSGHEDCQHHLVVFVLDSQQDRVVNSRLAGVGECPRCRGARHAIEAAVARADEWVEVCRGRSRTRDSRVIFALRFGRLVKSDTIPAVPVSVMDRTHVSVSCQI